MCGFGDHWVKNHADASDEAAKSRDALIIFIKNPELGKVKTRLASTIGDVAALDAYLGMLTHTRSVAEDLECEKFLFYANEIPANDEWSTAKFQKFVQAEGDLGHRMYSAFEFVFQKGFEKVLIIGSDCLDLRPSHLRLAFRSLANHDFVIGPANDGGYYLLGMKATEPSLFMDKNWSTSDVLMSTIEDIHRLQKSYTLLPELVDVDTEEDYKLALIRNKKA